MTALEVRVEHLEVQAQQTTELVAATAQQAQGATAAHGQNVKLLMALRETQIEHGQRLNVIDGRLNVIDRCLNAIDGRLNAIDGRLNVIDGRLDAVDGKLGMLTVGMHAIETLLGHLVDRENGE
ncbi:MAG TPA: hypothetical protein VH561_17135 [Micromonosporaceae bacterium]